MAVRRRQQTPHDAETTLLRQLGHRVTPQRLQIMHVLRTTDRPLTADELSVALAALQPIDPTTIYRVLTFLQETGLVVQLTPEQGRQRYKYRDPGDLHHHLVCMRCGCDFQVPDSVFAQLRDDLLRRYDFTLQIDHMLLPGLCTACRATASA